ncbi:MAG TPA: hypothetical protein VJQ09_05415, partial [Candidatus Limnocylindria bacterium]|nr:hypothetical protein [Candidatus Limnocylindria bacterium]
LASYLDAIERGAPRIDDPSADEPTDTAMLALRLDEGLDLAAYRRRFGDAWTRRIGAGLADATSLGLARLVGDVARLTPRGRLLASEVFVRLLRDDVVGEPRVAVATT